MEVSNSPSLPRSSGSRVLKSPGAHRDWSSDRKLSGMLGSAPFPPPGSGKLYSLSCKKKHAVVPTVCAAANRFVVDGRPWLG
ncbi:hypothetical protein E2562_002000 [Oryza meyeriana var. granulata]|uniref:Uncharacterized protein n=1 Tax=Oryza meyeriana var. granulata TaxID=110450 RepID=A0A6G1C3H0_9ORYZ|nr:hypothetical protein E2562_002000 [Oryza meyeriana var. granulata]